jgi:hypothetical protein
MPEICYLGENYYNVYNNVYKEYKCLPIDPDDCIVVNCNDIHRFNLEDVISTINTTRINYPSKKILFEQQREGFQAGTLNLINQVVKKLINEYKFILSDFVILNASFPSEYNIQLYKEYVEKNNLLSIKTFFANTMEIQFRRENKNIIDYKFDYNQKIKDFLLYIGKCNTYRIHLLSNLMRLNVLSNSYYTSYFQKEIIDNYMISPYPNYLQESIEHIKSLSNTFPIKLNPNDSFETIPMWKMAEEEKFHYDHCFFSIIPETIFFHNDQNLYDYHLFIDQVFITEKTYKMIAGQLPFILVGFTKSLQCLKEMGYKTFHPYIDESYDLIENDQDRLNAIIREIERLCKFSPTQWKEWADNIIPIVRHNQKVLINSSPKYVEVY